MPAYALGILPMLSAINNYGMQKIVHQSAYADDLAGSGTIMNLKSWWDNICEFGPKIGYIPEPSKSWLNTKELHYDSAVKTFEGTKINITTSGRKHLGGVIGSNLS